MNQNKTIRILPMAFGLFLIFGICGLFWYGKPDKAQAQDAAASPAAQSNTIGSAFTYQGYLQQGGAPVDGVACDFYFALWTEIAGGTQYGTQTINGVNVNEGVFTVQIDIGNVFTGDGVWMETAVQCPSDGGFTTLTPRQPITATPYALGLQPGAVISSTQPVGLSVNANDAPGQIALYAEADQPDSVAVYGNSENNTAVFGNSGTGRGIWGQSIDDEGVYGESFGDIGKGVVGRANGVYGTGVYGRADGQYGYGVLGKTNGQNGYGVVGTANGQNGYGVVGTANGVDGTGVYGRADASSGVGVYGRSLNNTAVYGDSTHGKAVWGQSSYDNGVYGSSAASNVAGVHGINQAASGIGVRGVADATGGVGIYGGAIDTAVYGESLNGRGVWGQSNSGTGVYGHTNASNGIGVHGWANTSGSASVYGETTLGTGIWGSNGGSNTIGWAGYFNGRVDVNGTLSRASGSSMIDHPLDPENMVLQHAVVESPDMMSIYNGNITTDAQGYATVTMPDYFEALNADFRYQLTVMGQFAQAIVARKIESNQFVIQTDKPNVTVSWLVTGIRHDAYANMNRILVEEEKPDDEKGFYLHPEAFGLASDAGIAAQNEQNQMR